MEVSQLLKQLDDAWPSPLVSRDAVEQFTGHLVRRKTLVNEDSLGSGPAQRVRMGRKVAYPKEALIEWLGKRLSVETVRT